MSDAEKKGKKLAQDLKAKLTKEIETFLDKPESRQYVIGEAVISLMEEGMPISKESLKEWIEVRISISSPGFGKTRLEHLLDWIESLPTPKTT